MSKEKKQKKEFVSDVTGVVWEKHNIARWQSIINHTAKALEDIVSETKSGETVTLEKGSEVLIDDIRGRINPQYRCRDSSGKVWFIQIEKLEILKNDTPTREEEVSDFGYRGGVRTDAQQPNAVHKGKKGILPDRY